MLAEIKDKKVATRAGQRVMEISQKKTLARKQALQREIKALLAAQEGNQ